LILRGFRMRYGSQMTASPSIVRIRRKALLSARESAPDPQQAISENEKQQARDKRP